MKPFMPLLRILILLAAAIGGIVMAQDRLLYHPDKASVAEISRFVNSAQPWPSSESFRGLLSTPPSAAVRGTILVFHGNAGHAGHRGFYVETLVPLGWRVILAEYPGYGPRDGKLGEESLVADAAETIALARSQFGEPVFLLGESLGAGVAAAASDRLRHEGIAGMLLITPWDRLQNVAAHHYPWLPVSWLLRDRYDSVKHLAGFRGRVAVVLADGDRIVPASFGRGLYDTLSAEKKLLVVAGADHNDWLELTDAGWWASLVRWLQAKEPRPGASP
jgi:alpha-beta hydrolase superfamily lysophospholipase